ncbi:Hint domain-containing protein [Roseinatronobacter sp. S2]|uniref:Hint domain-containing protein n=1 Tax=Roseinatronobacter sp. S2 TaxID=3035471 RepID=UPI00240FC7F3|nr:Hint domain-containing protein [Roseinatronobacter sp. S2]WFE73946.1 Hint domain-containing protein [Roseinatronobacter sp. S2]
MPVTINDLIRLGGAGVDAESFGTVFNFDPDLSESDLLEVLDGVEFERDDSVTDQSIPLGSTTIIDGVEYELTDVYNFWGGYTKIDPDTGESFTQFGQTISLTLTAEDGSQISFISPSDVFNTDDPWRPGEIQSVEVASTPTVEGAINEAGNGENKLSGDDDVTVPCFVAGTLIDTAEGRKPVEQIKVGDLVMTRDNGYLPVVWSGSRDLTAQDLSEKPDYNAVIIRAGALGDGMPQRDLRVSPWHRVLISGQRSELLFGEHEVLVPALHLVGQPGIERDTAPVTYVHVMFNSHQIIRGEGAWSESFQPGQKTLGGMDDMQRAELLSLFPELASISGQDAYAAARLTLKESEVRALLAA